MKNELLLIILFFFAFSCNQNPKPTEKTKNSNIKTDTTRILSEKYKKAFSFDTIINTIYTIDLNKMLLSDYQITSKFIVNDIYKHNNEYFIKIESFMPLPSFYFDLKVSESELKKIRERITTSFGLITESVLVLKVDSIKKIDFVLECKQYDCIIDIETGGYGAFLCKGNVVEFINYK